MKRVNPPDFDSKSRELLLLLGEELKQPLVAIAQLAELQAEAGSEMHAHARQALRTIDNILLYQRAHSHQLALRLEPVHLGSAIADVAHELSPLMRAAGCRTELHIQHGLAPVDVDRQLLTSGLQSLWQAFLGTLQASSSIICQARRTPQGIRLSLHSDGSTLESLHLSSMRRTSMQPVAAVAGPATDLLVAQGIFELLGSGLTKTVSGERVGLGATLRPSKQLQMV